MDAQAVLATARSGTLPEYWTVWPLRRERVRRGMLEWAAVTAFGFVVFIPVLLATVPDNFRSPGLKPVITSVLLVLLAVMAFGALSLFVFDVWRLSHADEFLLVMTPDDYVKSEPRGKVTHVPMDAISFVTMRGVKVREQFAQPTSDLYQIHQEGQISRMIGGIGVRREPVRAPSLAFLDTRSNREVIVATDDSFDELPALEYVLQLHVDAKERLRTG